MSHNTKVAEMSPTAKVAEISHTAKVAEMSPTTEVTEISHTSKGAGMSHTVKVTPAPRVSFHLSYTPRITLCILHLYVISKATCKGVKPLSIDHMQLRNNGCTSM